MEVFSAGQRFTVRSNSLLHLIASETSVPVGLGYPDDTETKNMLNYFCILVTVVIIVIATVCSAV